MLLEQRLTAPGEENDVLARDLGWARQEVEVGSDLGAGLIADLLHLEAHQVPELPVGHLGDARVAHVDLAASDADARARELELGPQRGPPGLDVARASRTGDGRAGEVERAAFPDPLECDGRAAADVAPDRIARHQPSSRAEERSASLAPSPEPSCSSSPAA